MLKKFRLSPFEALHTHLPRAVDKLWWANRAEAGVGWEETLLGSRVRAGICWDVLAPIWPSVLGPSGLPRCLPCLHHKASWCFLLACATFLSLWLDGETPLLSGLKNFARLSACTHQFHISFCSGRSWQDLGDLPGPRGDGRMGDE